MGSAFLATRHILTPCKSAPVSAFTLRRTTAAPAVTGARCDPYGSRPFPLSRRSRPAGPWPPSTSAFTAATSGHAVPSVGCVARSQPIRDERNLSRAGARLVSSRPPTPFVEVDGPSVAFPYFKDCGLIAAAFTLENLVEARSDSPPKVCRVHVDRRQFQGPISVRQPPCRHERFDLVGRLRDISEPSGLAE